MNRSPRWFAYLSFAALLSPTSCAAPPTEAEAVAGTPGVATGHDDPACAALVDELQSSLDAAVKARHLPGAAAAADVGDCHLRFASGVSDLVTKSPVRADGLFRVGSITKSFIATLLLSLRADDKISLDAPVSTYVSGVPGGDGITVRQILNHTSGIYNYLESNDFLNAVQEKPDRVWQPAELVAIAAANKPYFQPGAGFHYSNTNYIIAGLVAEKAGGRPLGELLRARVVEPAGLLHTYLDGAEPGLPGLVHGYSPQGSSFADVTLAGDASVTGAAGALVSNAADLNTFFHQLLGGERLGPAELDEMRTGIPTMDPTAPEYGLGLIERPSPLGPAFGHDGQIWGFISSSCYIPDAGASITVLVNTEQTDINGIIDDLARIVKTRL
jgi:D-alanyl-D-alanine carboxypeptidase